MSYSGQMGGRGKKLWVPTFGDGWEVPFVFVITIKEGMG
jgi:hypothetical protein